MALKLAFAGFRHYHILDLYEYAKKSGRIEIVASAEDEQSVVDELPEKGVTVTHASIDDMFGDAESFDAVAVGDYYARRGSLALQAIRAGKHVILDKPICTSLDELDAIESESRTAGVVIGCMLNNRDSGIFRGIKRLLAEGTIGELQALSFNGQHPLNYGTRPGWYFEQGKHGGTINDIAIHAIDLLPWLTGHRIERCIAARVWNTRLKECPHFQVGAQFMLKLQGGAGVMGDVSYLSPDSQGYTVPHYWRHTIHGTKGTIEGGTNLPNITVWQDGKDSPYSVPPDAERDGGVFEDFLDEIEGNTRLCDLTGAQALASARECLKIQKTADEGGLS